LKRLARSAAGASNPYRSNRIEGAVLMELELA